MNTELKLVLIAILFLTSCFNHKQKTDNQKNVEVKPSFQCSNDTKKIDIYLADFSIGNEIDNQEETKKNCHKFTYN